MEHIQNILYDCPLCDYLVEQILVVWKVLEAKNVLSITHLPVGPAAVTQVTLMCPKSAEGSYD